MNMKGREQNDTFYKTGSAKRLPASCQKLRGEHGIDSPVQGIGAADAVDLAHLASKTIRQNSVKSPSLWLQQP